ncbi:MAG: glyoxalase/bleomycin resistance/extradiol dioxygenase family protein [Rhodobacteraceae bacterium]|nr:glyoxalase/bleomycin resistance/extradiol dioxygenase family protein [Paracoccaceae bacterium]MBR9821031.1 glyoxalase/bleomycin resistance/extradiol dioxygenase family protein [Paracoccaceae bacterium]
MSQTFDPRVFQLGYVGLGVTDLSRTRDYYASTMGLVETARGDGASFLSVGAEHHNLVLQQADEKTFLHQGYQLNAGTDLADFTRGAEAFGLAPTRKSDAHPGIPELVEIEAPGGNVFQFYTEIAVAEQGYSRSGISPMRLGHLAVVTPEAARLRKFYEDFLGFHYTDDIGGVATFLTCNRDHHVVNVVGLPESRVHHIAFELYNNAHHSTACDILARAGKPTLWGPARHYSGHNLAGYHYDPDQVMIELYTEMDIYVPAAGAFEPRPWHEENPQRPMSWKPEQMTQWETSFEFDLVTA